MPSVVRSHEGREPVAPARVDRTGARGRGEQATHPGSAGLRPAANTGCMGHLGPFVPDDVRLGVNALFEAKFDGLTYDQVCARVPWAVSAYEGWLERGNESRRDHAYAGRHPKPRS